MDIEPFEPSPGLKRPHSRSSLDNPDIAQTQEDAEPRSVTCQILLSSEWQEGIPRRAVDSSKNGRPFLTKPEMGMLDLGKEPDLDNYPWQTWAELSPSVTHLRLGEIDRLPLGVRYLERLTTLTIEKFNGAQLELMHHQTGQLTLCVQNSDAQGRIVVLCRSQDSLHIEGTNDHIVRFAVNTATWCWGSQDIPQSPRLEESPSTVVMGRHKRLLFRAVSESDGLAALEQIDRLFALESQYCAREILDSLRMSNPNQPHNTRFLIAEAQQKRMDDIVYCLMQLTLAPSFLQQLSTPEIHLLAQMWWSLPETRSKKNYRSQLILLPLRIRAGAKLLGVLSKGNDPITPCWEKEFLCGLRKLAQNTRLAPLSRKELFYEINLITESNYFTGKTDFLRQVLSICASAKTEQGKHLEEWKGKEKSLTICMKGCSPTVQRLVLGALEISDSGLRQLDFSNLAAYQFISLPAVLWISFKTHSDIGDLDIEYVTLPKLMSVIPEAMSTLEAKAFKLYQFRGKQIALDPFQYSTRIQLHCDFGTGYPSSHRMVVLKTRTDHVASWSWNGEYHVIGTTTLPSGRSLQTPSDGVMTSLPSTPRPLTPYPKKRRTGDADPSLPADASIDPQSLQIAHHLQNSVSESSHHLVVCGHIKSLFEQSISSDAKLNLLTQIQSPSGPTCRWILDTYVNDEVAKTLLKCLSDPGFLWQLTEINGLRRLQELLINTDWTCNIQPQGTRLRRDSLIRLALSADLLNHLGPAAGEWLKQVGGKLELILRDTSIWHSEPLLKQQGVLSATYFVQLMKAVSVAHDELIRLANQVDSLTAFSCKPQTVFSNPSNLELRVLQDSLLQNGMSKDSIGKLLGCFGESELFFQHLTVEEWACLQGTEIAIRTYLSKRNKNGQSGIKIIYLPPNLEALPPSLWDFLKAFTGLREIHAPGYRGVISLQAMVKKVQKQRVLKSVRELQYKFDLGLAEKDRPRPVVKADSKRYGFSIILNENICYKVAQRGINKTMEKLAYSAEREDWDSFSQRLEARNSFKKLGNSHILKVMKLMGKASADAIEHFFQLFQKLLSARDVPQEFETHRTRLWNRSEWLKTGSSGSYELRNTLAHIHIQFLDEGLTDKAKEVEATRIVDRFSSMIHRPEVRNSPAMRPLMRLLLPLLNSGHLTPVLKLQISLLLHEYAQWLVPATLDARPRVTRNMASGKPPLQISIPQQLDISDLDALSLRYALAGRTIILASVPERWEEYFFERLDDGQQWPLIEAIVLRPGLRSLSEINYLLRMTGLQRLVVPQFKGDYIDMSMVGGPARLLQLQLDGMDLEKVRVHAGKHMAEVSTDSDYKLLHAELDDNAKNNHALLENILNNSKGENFGGILFNLLNESEELQRQAMVGRLKVGQSSLIDRLVQRRPDVSTVFLEKMLNREYSSADAMEVTSIFHLLLETNWRRQILSNIDPDGTQSRFQLADDILRKFTQGPFSHWYAIRAPLWNKKKLEAGSINQGIFLNPNAKAIGHSNPGLSSATLLRHDQPLLLKYFADFSENPAVYYRSNSQLLSYLQKQDVPNSVIENILDSLRTDTLSLRKWNLGEIESIHPGIWSECVKHTAEQGGNIVRVKFPTQLNCTRK